MFSRDRLKRFIFRHKRLGAFFTATVQRARIQNWQKELHANGWDILQRISAALNEHNIDYFLDSGTLLGMIREGGFISHDTDIDMGMLFNDSFSEEILERAMTAAGLKRHHAFYYHDKPAVITYVYDSINIDFFMYFKTETPDRWLQYCFERSVWKTYPSEDIFDVYQADCPITGLKTIRVHDLELSVPENAEEYLASIYTESWRVPNPNWNYLDSPRARLLDGENGIRK